MRRENKPFSRQAGVELSVQEAVLLGCRNITSEQNEPKRMCDFVDPLPFIHFLISYEVPSRLTPANMLKADAADALSVLRALCLSKPWKHIQ